MTAAGVHPSRPEATPTVEPAAAAARAEWDAFVARRPEGDILQGWAWGEAVAPTGERPVRLVARGADGSIRGLAVALVRRSSLGRQVLYVPHGPLWEREAPDADGLLDALLAGLRAAARVERGIVVKLDPRGRPGEDPGALRSRLLVAGARSARLDLQAPTTRIVDLLDGGERLRRTWDADTRNLAGRSVREGVVVDIHRDADRDSTAIFHALLSGTAERSSFRARPLDFLQRLARELAVDGGWYLALARLEGRAIAGMAVPRIGDRAYYLYGASLREPALKHAFGAYAAMSEMMRVLAGDGVRTLDLWGVVERGDQAADPSWEGFSAFKRTFGGTPLRHPGTFDLVVNPLWYAVRDWRERRRGAGSW